MSSAGKLRNISRIVDGSPSSAVNGGGKCGAWLWGRKRCRTDGNGRKRYDRSPCIDPPHVGTVLKRLRVHAARGKCRGARYAALNSHPAPACGRDLSVVQEYLNAAAEKFQMAMAVREKSFDPIISCVYGHFDACSHALLWTLHWMRLPFHSLLVMRVSSFFAFYLAIVGHGSLPRSTALYLCSSCVA